VNALGSLALAAGLLVTLDAEAQPWLPYFAPPFPKAVAITNFPNPQNVAGSVAVTNLPAVQDVNVVNAPPPAGAAARVQLVGFTSATFPGTQGVLAFTLACQQEFANSRMCSSLEILETDAVPGGLAGEAWVRPSLVVANAPSGTVIDASGVAATADRMTCDGWRGAPQTGLIASGLVVDASGRFRVPGLNIDECGIARSIACCAAVE
jgi:hypothetical protein